MALSNTVRSKVQSIKLQYLQSVPGVDYVRFPCDSHMVHSNIRNSGSIYLN